MTKIIVKVLPNGEVKIDAVGFKGNACEKATQEIAKLLGITASSGKKPEYYQNNQINQTQSN